MEILEVPLKDPGPPSPPGWDCSVRAVSVEVSARLESALTSPAPALLPASVRPEPRPSLKLEFAAASHIYFSFK